MFIILAKRKLRWLGHVTRMEDGELATGSRPAGRPTLRYKDVCKRDLRAGDIAPTDLEALAADRNVWRLTTKSAAVKIERATRDEEAAQTSEGSIGYLGRHSLCVPDLQEDLPLTDWALQPQSPLQLNHGMTTKVQTHCLPSQKDANNNMISHM